MYWLKKKVELARQNKNVCYFYGIRTTLTCTYIFALFLVKILNKSVQIKIIMLTDFQRIIFSVFSWNPTPLPIKYSIK